MTEIFKVKETVKLNKREQTDIQLKDAIFFYHGWLRTEFELIEIAHDMLINLAACGLVCNYDKTSEYKTIKGLIEQHDRVNDHHSKVRLNCSITGQFEWIDHESLREVFDYLIWKISDYINSAYSLENYYCGFNDGDWGLFYSHE